MITKLFDEAELSELRKKVEGDAQLERLLNFYLLNDCDGVAAFERSLNNLLQVFADSIDTKSDNFSRINKEDLDRLLEIGVEGGKMAKNLKELRKKVGPVGRPAKEQAAETTEEEDPEEPTEEIDDTPVVNAWGNDFRNQQ